jgi:hypothetical protein
MTKTAAMLLTLIALAMPAQAQQRVFVSSTGLDTNPCTVAQPCRTFQHAHDIAVANGEIDVIDPAGYGPLVISKGISIQAHGFGGITQTSNPGVAIAIAVTTGDPVSLNGLLLDGAGTGNTGIFITSGQSVQILNSVIRHFSFGIVDQTNTLGSTLLIQDTVASDNLNTGILVAPTPGGSVQATLSRITANNNTFGVGTGGTHLTTIANSVMSNNSNGLQSNAGVNWLAKTVISGNARGVNLAGAAVFSYGDNYINDNITPVVGGNLTTVTTQ